MHFASFYGNIYMCKYLLSMGGDAFVTNQHYINMLHVAAQGDQPKSLVFF